MSLQNRETLKAYFKKGQLPTEGNFHDLIDSQINKVDDGMTKTVEDGLMLSPIGDSKKLISFYKSIEDKTPEWRVEIDDKDANLFFSNKFGDTIGCFNEQGKFGVNNTEPTTEFEVNGYATVSGRAGNAYKGKVPADGKWHKIVTGVNGCHMLEVIAGTGKKKTGNYALMHAIAISTYGKSKNKIRKTCARYGIWANRIQLKWTGNVYDFNLEIRTRANYGENIAICYNIQNLWQDTFMNNCTLDDNK